MEDIHDKEGARTVAEDARRERAQRGRHPGTNSRVEGRAMTTPPKRKPRKVREWWIVIIGEEIPAGIPDDIAFRRENTARARAKRDGGEVVKVREVRPDVR
jgi:hypothetical protein